MAEHRHANQLAMLTSTGNSNLPSSSVALSDQPIHRSPYRGREKAPQYYSLALVPRCPLLSDSSPRPLAPSFPSLAQRDTYPPFCSSLYPVLHCVTVTSRVWANSAFYPVFFAPSVRCTLCRVCSVCSHWLNPAETDWTPPSEGGQFR